MANYYDTDRIINEAIRAGIDIAPDRTEWVKLCHALKILGEDENTFVALSRCHGTSDKDSRARWRYEKATTRYIKGENEARAFIAAVAKAHGMDITNLTLPQEEWQRRRADRRRTPTPRPLPPLPPANEPPKVVEYIPRPVVERMQATATQTALFKFMAGEWGTDAAASIFAAYHIGGSKHIDRNGHRAASLPYIDRNGNCVDCKLWSVDPDTGSSKGKDGNRIYLNWALATMGKSDRRAAWCNFGDHLLADRPGDAVCIVESEKTALIAALTWPGKIWVAVGSIANLNAGRCEQYRGRAISIFPDRDGMEQWEAKAKALRENGFEVTLNRVVATFVGGNNDDIADIILRQRHGTLERVQPQAPPPPRPGSNERPKATPPADAVEVWERMKANNPYLADLERALDLQLIGFAPDLPTNHKKTPR